MSLNGNAQILPVNPNSLFAEGQTLSVWIGKQAV